MADHNKPVLTSTYANFVSELDGRFDDLALGLDPAFTTATNVPVNSIRWSSAANTWQKWNGTAWNSWSNSFVVNGTFTATLNASVGGALSASNGLNLTNSALTGVTQRGISSTPTATSSATTAVYGVVGAGNTAAAAFTTTNSVGFYAQNATKGAGSTISSQHGVFVEDQTQGGANYGLTTDVSSGTNKWNIYSQGTASNYFNAPVFIGGTNVAVGGLRLSRSAATSTIYGANSTGSNLVLSTSNTSGVETERVRIDSAGNVGIGTAPSAWGLLKGIEMGSGVYLASANNTVAYVGSNNYYNGTNFIYKTTNFAAQYRQTDGVHQWFTAASGTAGGNITFSQPMTLNTAGQWLLGVTTYTATPALGVTINPAAETSLNIGHGVSAGTGSNYINFVYNGVSIGALRQSGTTGVTLNGGANLSLSGTIVTAPTVATADSSTSVATTAFVKNQAYAPLASPALTGTPTAPTAAVGNSSTQIATTAYVQSNALGMGQTWQSFNSTARASGTTYTNDTGRPICIAVTSASSTSSTVAITVSGVVIIRHVGQVGGGAFEASATVIVPASATYSAVYAAGTWFELR